MLDTLDQKIVAALQVDGRASWARVAATLGVSERTVTRRIKPLLGRGTVRVTAVRNPFRRAAMAPLSLRITCAPGQAPTVAGALARRADTMSVHLLEGGSDLAVTVFAPDHAHRDALFLRELPATRPVISWTAATLLRVFRESLHWRAPLLTPGQAARLAPPDAATTGPGEPGDALDDRLITLLARDARMPLPELARRAGTAESTARRRLSRLTRDGSFRIAADVDPALLGHHVEAVLRLSVRPDRLEPVGRLLAARPEARLVAATSGPHNLLAALICRDLGALYRFLTEDAGAQAGVTTVDTAVVVGTVKRYGVATR